jgi:hypothetical protein
MAEDSKKSFPKIPAKNWWDLRRRFKQSPPKSVDADFLQSVLGLGSAGAAANLIPPLRVLGLIDESGKLTGLANDWRSDESYAEACNKMRQSMYPDGLINAFPPPDPDPAGVKSWFARNAGVGDAAARQMATFYRLLCDGDPSGEGTRTAKPTSVSTSKSVSTSPKAMTNRRRKVEPLKDSGPPAPEVYEPSLQVAIQVYIPTGATPDQIDAIFSSMARHMYRRAP